MFFYESILFNFTLSISINLIFFLISYVIKKDIFTDITYAMTFILINYIFFALDEYSNISKLLLISLLIIWALRLGFFLAIRVAAMDGIDSRFNKIRNNFFYFLFFWIIQAITISICSIPLIYAFTGNTFNIGIFEGIFLILAFLGFLIESISDFQKFNFKNKNPSMFMSIGFFKYSRYPNYFGELTFWWCLSLAILELDNTNSYYILISPIYLTFLIFFVSGINILEKNSKDKYGYMEEYEEYVKNTNKFFFNFIYFFKDVRIYIKEKSKKNN